MKRMTWRCILWLIPLIMMITSCEKQAELGSEENPVVWSFVPSGEMDRVAEGADKVAAMLHDKTGFYFKTNVAADYAGVIQDLTSDPPQVHISSLATFSYILAADRGVAEAALVSTRFGSAVYKGQFIAGRDTGIKTLADLEGRTFARPDPLSTSGWIMPMLTMYAAGINPEKDLKEILDFGSHDSVVTAVYNGEVEAGSTYQDARTRFVEDYPDIMEKVIVIEITSGIPNDGIQFSPTVLPEMRQKIIEALLDIAASEEGIKALGMAYQWEGLEIHGDDFYDPFRQALSGIRSWN